MFKKVCALFDFTVIKIIKTMRDETKSEKEKLDIIYEDSDYQEKVEEEVAEILGFQILANIQSTRKFRKSLHKQMPLAYLYPRSKSAKQFKNLANHLCLDNY